MARRHHLLDITKQWRTLCGLRDQRSATAEERIEARMQSRFIYISSKMIVTELNLTDCKHCLRAMK